MPLKQGNSMYIHVGYPKCASTFLQKQFFAIHNELEYVGYESREFLSLFLNARESLYSPELVRRLFKSEDKTKILSHELLVGEPFHSDFEGDFYARRLQETFQEAKIIIIVRNQEQAIESYFMMWVRGGMSGRFGAEDFFKTVALNRNRVGFNFGYYEYSKTIRYYQELFGRENVNIFLFEDFRKDIDLFIDNICRLMEVTSLKNLDKRPRKEKITPLAYVFMRLMNRYRTSIFNPCGGFLDFIPWLYVIKTRNVLDMLSNKINPNYRKKRWVSNDHIDKIRDYYRKDNKILCEILGRDLNEYNYPV